MEGKLVSTDLGLLSPENANWLYFKGVISRAGNIKSNIVNGIIEKRVQLYSHFRWIVEDIKEKIPSAPKQVEVGIDDFVTLMREGNIKKEYETKEGKFNYIANYPVVDSLYNCGKKSCLEHQTYNGKKKQEIVDFDNI